MKNQKRKYYHVSGYRFHKGDVIGGPGKLVFMHITPITHFTIEDVIDYNVRCFKETSAVYKELWDKVDDKEKKYSEVYDLFKKELKKRKKIQIWCYEVQPYKKPWLGSWDDFITDSFVEIVKVVGNARGITQNFTKKFGNASKAYHFGRKSYYKNK